MFEEPDEYFLFGDVFIEVPIPVVDASALLANVDLDEGPALLIDGDCSVCKLGANAFNFAPLMALEDLVPDPASHGNVRAGRVRRYFYLEPTQALGNIEWVVDLQNLFSLPRDVFPHEQIHLAPTEKRIRPLGHGPYNGRAVRLNVDRRNQLRLHLAGFLELAKVET